MTCARLLKPLTPPDGNWPGNAYVLAKTSQPVYLKNPEAIERQ